MGVRVQDTLKVSERVLYTCKDPRSSGQRVQHNQWTESLKDESDLKVRERVQNSRNR